MLKALLNEGFPQSDKRGVEDFLYNHSVTIHNSREDIDFI